MEMQEFEITQGAVFVQLNHPASGLPLFEQMSDPENEGKTIDNPDEPVGVEIYGADSEQFKKYQRKSRDQGIDAMSRRQRIRAELIEENALDALAACIKSIRNISWKGQKLEAPRDNKKMLKVMPWAEDQIDRAMGDRTRFMPALSKTS